MATYAAGTIVFFYHQAELCLGIVSSAEGNRLLVLDTEGAEHLLPTDRITLASLDTFLPAETRTLSTFIDMMEQSLGFLESEGVPAQLAHLPAPFSFDQASEAVGCLSDFCRFALFKHLRLRDDLYLMKKGVWRARDEEETAAFLEKKEKEAARARYLDAVADFLERLETAESGMQHKKAPEFGTGAEDERQLAAESRALLISGEPKDLARILRAGGRNLERSVHALRLALGDIIPDTDPVAAASGIPISFSSGLASGAVTPEQTEPEGFEAFTIDAEDSGDLDDAIDWQETASGWSLGIHISDVAACIPLHGELWRAAQDRVASLYLPSQTVPLLPVELSGGVFSLLESEARPVLSLRVELDREARVVHCSWRRGWLRVKKNLSYENFDNMLRCQERSPLLELCRKLRDARVGESEERKHRYSWNLKVVGGDVVMQREDNLSPSRFVVEELMILYNRLMAERACQSGLPLIYRNVTQWSENEEDTDNYSIQAYLSTEAKFHPGVGVQAYLHATSPIRRFTDIVNQAQFSALLAGNGQCFSRQDLEELIFSIEKRLQLLRAVAHRSERYWLLRWLEQKHLGEPLDAVPLRRVKQGWLMELSRWEKRLVLRCEEDLPLRTSVKLVVASVDMKELLVRGDIIL